jgi:hypothetical protein
MKNLLEQLTGMSELVILDSTPLLTVSDSLPLVEIVSGVVAVARLNKTSKEAVRRLEQVIINAGGTLLGSVATGAAATGLYGGYGYPDPPSADGRTPRGPARKFRAGSLRRGGRLIGRRARHGATQPERIGHEEAPSTEAARR